MSRRVWVPAPFGRLQPSVIRQFGPRLVLLIGGFAAVAFVVGGGSYVLSHIGAKTPSPAHTTTPTPLSTDTPPAAQVLATMTDTASQPPAVSNPSVSTAASSTPVAAPAVSPAAPAAHKATPSLPATPAPPSLPSVQGAVQTLLAPLQQLLNLP